MQVFPLSTAEGALPRPSVHYPLAIMTLLTAAWGHTAMADETRLSTTVVTATRSETLLDETLADVRVVTAEQISQSTGRSLAEVLQRFAGVQMSSNGGRGNTQSVYIRGSKQVVLLIDGVRYGSATTGAPTLESLPLEAIERIEVVHGPASALYGSDAVGGVIQIFTKQGRGARQAFTPYASLTWGRAGYKKADGGFAGTQSGWNYSLNLARVVDPGFSATNFKVGYDRPDADKLNQTSMTAALGYAFNANWRLDANLMRSDSSSEFDLGTVTLPDWSQPQVDGSYSALKAATAQLKLSGKLATTWQSHLSVSRSNDEQRTHHRLIGSVNHYQDLFQTEQTEYKWGNEIRTSLGMVVTGMERLEQKISSAERYDRTERSTDAVYAGLNGGWQNHSWQVNLRRDDNSQFGGFNTWGIGYGYEFLPGLRAHASRASSLKAPTFNDLYYPFSGNPNLRPESAKGNELGLDWAWGVHQFKLTRFDNKIKNMIAWAPVDPGNPGGMWQPFNVDSARLKGWTLGYQLAWHAWALTANYEHLDAYNGKGQRLRDRLPEHQASLSLDKRFGAWRLGTSALYVGSRTDVSGSLHLGGYSTMDVHAEYQFATDWVLQGRVANLTDRVYETAYGYNQRGRAGFLTLKWTPR
ncbi:TonB-dependent receptor [Comamonas aquatica]|uniref:TonB-dependent receptor domain-containing protein n=2 Tax=Comamonas aquatica TaxID=225991 RepID=UPI00244B1352|nr:TonB-dependent receptor [Comamonas aquatica]